MLSKAGPVAQHEAKRLALGMQGLTEERVARIDQDNAALIARLRVSEEGQEGLAAFLDKRAPAWTHGR
jgi:methylglutaconyl-CoA hydratase